MKIVYMGILRNDVTPAIALVGEYELMSFSRFTRGTIKEVLAAGTTVAIGKTQPGQRNNIEHHGWNLHSYCRSEGAGAIIVTDPEYPSMTVQHILSRLLDEFITKNPKTSWPTQGPDNQMKFPELSTYLQQYQNPENADSLIKIQKELDETKVMLHKTIDAVLDRGENLQKLMADTGKLSESSEALFNRSKKMNSCCIVM